MIKSTTKRSRWPALFIALLVAVAVGLFAVHARYGAGKPYPDLSTAPELASDQLELVLEYPEPLGNAAVTSDGRVFFTIHPESRPQGNKLLVRELDGGIRPFPSREAQGKLFDAVMGVAIDARGTLWTIDHGQHGSGAVRLIAFDTRSGNITFDFTLPSNVAPLGSMLQDLQVDSNGAFVYLADVSFWRNAPGLVVVDVKNRRSWRALTGHAAVMPQDWLVRAPAKDMVFLGGLLALKPGVDGIAISKDDQWLAFGAMTHDTLFRVPTTAIATPELAATAASKLEAIGRKPLNDGLSMDKQGNIYITDVEHSSVMRMNPQGRLTTVIRDDRRLRWPDSLSYGPDGYLYVCDSAIPHQMLQSKEHMKANTPYAIYRFKPGTEGVAGQ